MTRLYEWSLSMVIGAIIVCAALSYGLYKSSRKYRSIGYLERLLYTININWQAYY